MTSWPDHTEVPDERHAVAPYNFVPLPARVMTVSAPPPANRYHADRHTGEISWVLTTESPTYIRCGLTDAQFAQAELEHRTPDEAGGDGAALTKNTPDFFYTQSPNQPVIPGSSLRGMLRTLVEIAGFGKLERVTDHKMFFRALADPTLKQEYHRQFIEEDKVNSTPRYRVKVRAGFMRQRGGAWVLEECPFGRVDHRTISRGLDRPPHIGQGPNRYPNPDIQHATVYATMDPAARDHFFPRQMRPNGGERHPNLYLHFRNTQALSWTPQPGAVPTTLVISGMMQFKHLEFVFLHGEPLNTFSIPRELIQRFHDDDQLSQWQEKAFPKNTQGRPRDGWLRDGEPVFFLTEPGNPDAVRFWGRAQMFRLPYPYSVKDFVPEALRRESDLDLADALFGFVRGSWQEAHQDQAAASRVFVSDAPLEPGQGDVFLQETPLTPQILASPKPTTFQHYLVQTDTARHQLKHYATPPGVTVVRGHKLYWHQGAQPAISLPDDQLETSDSQKTAIRPVKPQTRFRVRVRFENISAMELGTLLWVVQLATQPQYRLSIGMGKPLGMGAIRFSDMALTLSQRVPSPGGVSRYTRLFTDNGQGWEMGETTDTADMQAQCITAFTSAVCAALGHTGTLESHPRIQQLLTMLQWPGPAVDLQANEKNASPTRYLEIERRNDTPFLGVPRNGKVNEYAERRVLPTPRQVAPPPAVSKAPPNPAQPPKPGQDRRGKVKEYDRENRTWIVTLDGGFEVRAVAQRTDLKPLVKSGKTVMVRVGKEVGEIRRVE